MKQPDLTQPLMTWYDAAKRVLPWRLHPDPYHIFISEIMLQQTRMETVLPYFERFVKQVPNFQTLASIDEDELYKLWQGLGYYRRAANLKKAAQMVIKDYGGILPASYSELLKLPGIGEYTAGAIASTAFQQSVIAVDGNVKRVIARLKGIHESVSDPLIDRLIKTVVMDLMPQNRPGDYIQALMELGALVCLPSGSPHCDLCPWQSHCVTNLAKDFDLVPLKVAKTARKSEQKTILILQYLDTVYLHKRPSKGLLSHLWEFLTLDGQLSLEEVKQYVSSRGFAWDNITVLPIRKHVFSHIEWQMVGFLVRLSAPVALLEGLFVFLEELTAHYSIPSAFQGYLDDFLSTRNSG